MNIFCKDCKWSRGSEFSGLKEYIECVCPEVPKNTTINYATGTTTKKPWLESCSVLRQDNWFSARLLGTCGKGARWFEPKEQHGT